jgi:hypothetical protein
LLHTNTIYKQNKSFEFKSEWDSPHRTIKLHPPPTHHSFIASKLEQGQFQSFLPSNQLPAFAPFSFKILSHLDSSFPICLTKLASVRNMYSWPYFHCIFGPCVQISCSLFFCDVHKSALFHTCPQLCTVHF